MFTVFKKGDRNNPNDYRDISATNAIAKLYDARIYERLCKWFRPCREQAAAQKKRSCMENIVTLRFITDTAKRKKFKLFVTFGDFSKAYNLILRHKFFDVLKRLGCGAIMLAAIAAMYHITENVIGSDIISASVGVRQGLSTSCFLFIVFVDMLRRRMKDSCPREIFLEWLHILMLVDDTV